LRDFACLAALREIFILQHNLSPHAKSPKTQSKRQVRDSSSQASILNHDQDRFESLAFEISLPADSLNKSAVGSL
jgi:hypothetical protein